MEDFETLKSLIELLRSNQNPDSKYKRHKLRGNLKDYECLHIKSDWLLVFRTDSDFLTLVMPGKHTRVYRKFS